MRGVLTEATIQAASGVPLWLLYLGSLIGVFGFFLACLSLYLQRRDKRPRLNIHYKTGRMTGLPNPEDSRAQFLIANPGERTISIAAVHLLLKGDTKIAADTEWGIDTEGNLGFSPIPCKLGPGESISLITNLQRLANILQNNGHPHTARFKIEVTDATNKTYTKRLKIRINADSANP